MPPSEKVPFWFADNGSRAKVTVPVGVLAVPAALLSATVTSHVAGFSNGTYVGKHLLTVLAERKPTRNGVLPLVIACVASPE